MRRSINPVWARWESASATFTRHEVETRWKTQLAFLRPAGLLVPTLPAAEWWCDDCGEHHSVQYHDFPAGKQAIVICNAGSIRLSVDQVDRFALDTESMLRWLFADSRVAVESIIANHLWKIGRYTLRGRSRELLFVRGAGPSHVNVIRERLVTHPKAILFTPTTGSADHWRTIVRCSVFALEQVAVLNKSNPIIDWDGIEDAITVRGSDADTSTKPRRKRGTRTAKIERLRDELKRHLAAAADHAIAAAETEAGITLLPRPSKTQLAKLTGMTKPDVTRCFADPTATELNLLWDTADDLEAILRLRGRSQLAK
ncbi:hypothetical protein [Crateriforma conspicua]|uniref:hypothetical protein n=1 Tax=Crateriforma conspicua TaxID=2527996 RepID=UPI0011889BA9|nr:hypothetical protein [Crateriforma conspicua]QDV62641.1 hypothetical protein Mal65_17750 [Crateriforma conspicua]